MQNMTNPQDPQRIMIIREGSREDDALIALRTAEPTAEPTAEASEDISMRADSYPAHVWVSKPHRYHVTRQGRFDVVGGDGDQVYGQMVVGNSADRRLCFSRFLRGSAAYEPKTRNRIGGLGAYRDAPPSSEALAAAIEEARAAVARAENGMGRPRELENPDRVELRIPAALLERLDAARGAMSRSVWIRMAIEQRLERDTIA